MNKFYEQLSKLVPEGEDEKEQKQLMVPFKVDHIARMADAFTGAMDEVPSNRLEMRDLLYVFGQVLDGHLQERLQYLTNLQLDALRYSLPIMTVKKGE